ncbi:MAG: 3-oxoadipate enol-lactonase [Hyphomicrobiales bacterium]|nr:3-oxoadipate enol-lactonase [Hyphomicrobiales bacterium]
MGQLKIGSESFNVEIEGPDDAPVLMLSNSLGTDLHMWEPQMAELTKRFRVVRYDSRGHGQSVAGDGPYSIAMLGRDALAIMDALDLHQVNWLGLSMGGMVGQWLLAHAPNRISRAVLANTSSYMPDSRPWNTRILTVQNEGMDAVAQTVVDRWFTPEFQGRDPAAVERIATMLRHVPPQGYVAACAAVRDMDLRETIRIVSKPVLVIAGTRDPATPAPLNREIAESIPGAAYVELDTAHLSNIERPEEFTAAVVKFLTAPIRAAAAPRKAAAKKAATKKAAVKKAVTRKAVVSKAPAKKSATKQAAAKKAPAKTKAPAKKAAAKKVAAKKPAAKKAVAKKAPARKAAAKTTARKAAVKKAPAKKAAARKGATKQAVAKKSTMKKAAPKKTAAKKAAPRKAARKTMKRKAR